MGFFDWTTDYGGGEGSLLMRHKWIIIVLGIVLVSLILMTAMGVGMQDLGLGSGPAKPQELVFWRRFDPLVPLRVTYNEIGNRLEFDRYTIIIDMVWFNTRVTTASNTYRHIMHRGSGEGADFLQATQLAIQNAGATGTGTATQQSPTESEILTRMPQGLPIRMNPGIMADPVKNDMLIFIDTERETEDFRESVRIPDVPMDQPFRLALVVMPNMVEVYINCMLEVTKMLEGRPRQMEDAWYGLIGPKPLPSALQNLRILNGVLGTGQIKTYCASNIEFPDTVMQSCLRVN